MGIRCKILKLNCIKELTIAGFFIVALIIVSIPTLAEADDEEEEFYNNIEYVRINLSISTGLQVNALKPVYEISYIRANLLFFPRDSERQKIKSLAPRPDAEIIEDSLFFEWIDPPAEDLEFGYNADIEVSNTITKIRDKIHYPLKEDFSEEIREYILATTHIDSHDPDIVALASNLAAGEDDLYVIVDKLATWTKDNIAYNLSTTTASISQSASWTLENRQGVCDELTSLFIAMARALGIPARFISGIAYTNSDLFVERWGPHGWAEVYFPDKGWIPFDPTYGQHGSLDPSHIALKKSADPGDPTTKYEWQAKNIDINTQQLEISVDEYEKGGIMEPMISMEGSFLKKAVKFGSYQLFEVNVINLNDYYVATSLLLSKPKEISIINKPETSIVLEPYANKTLYWILKVESELDDSMRYKFPITVMSPRNETITVEFSSYHEYGMLSYDRIKTILEQKKEEEVKAYSADVILNCDTDRDIIYFGEEAEIICKVKNAGNILLEGVEVCMDEDCQSYDIPINQEYEARFMLKSKIIGIQQKSVIAKNAMFTKLALVDFSILDKPSMAITNITIPARIGYNENYTLHFTLVKSSMSIPKNISVVLDVGGVENKWHIEELDIDNLFKINMNSKSLGIGENNININVEYHDEIGEIYSKKETAFISLENVSLWERIMIAMYQLNNKIISYAERWQK